MKEEWKTIPRFAYYAASSKGRIKSILRKVRYEHKNGKEFFRWKKERILTLFPQNGGYLLAYMSIDGHHYAKTVHCLVAEAFIGRRPKGMEVCHNNGVRIDNSVKNLRYDTPSNNRKQMIEHGTCPFTAAKLSPQDIPKIRKMHGSVNVLIVANKFGVGRKAIESIWYRKSWNHVK